MTRRDALILTAILGLASVLRFVELPGRGTWDDDQGNALMEMLLWVRDGQVPLLGPPSSIGVLHHGVGFYWLLAPSAFLTDVSPVAAAATLAVVGVAGVAATWWLGRTVGGAVAGHIAGLLMAVSPSAISSSTFVWNSNIVAPGAALATAAAWHAWRTQRARWWLVAAVGTLVMLQGHFLAAIGVPPLVALVVADVLRRPREDRRAMLVTVLGAVAIVASGYIPLLIHELRSGFSEMSAVVGYRADAGTYDLPPLVVRPLIILWRIEVWPLSGHIPSAVLGGLPAAIVVTAALVIAATGKAGTARLFGRWAAASILWATLALTVVSPSLASFTPGLPNDQYHGWLAPIVFAVVGVAVSRLKASAVALVVTCLVLAVASMPPLRSPDGGWPKAAETAAHIRSLVRGQPVAVMGVVKSGAALAFPLVYQGTPIAPVSTAEYLVVTCDPLFARSIGAPCGGPAETAYARRAGFPAVRLTERFNDSPRRVVCVFSRS